MNAKEWVLSMANKQALPWILDIEASGIHEDSYPIQVAWSNGLARHSCFVKPEPSWMQWDAMAEEIHGISRQCLMRKGLPVRKVANMMNELLHGLTLYSDAIQFDQAWCKKLFDAAEIDMQFEIADFWLLLTPYVPVNIRSEHDLTDWIQKIELKARSSLGSNLEHRADGDVSLLLGLIGTAREEMVDE